MTIGKTRSSISVTIGHPARFVNFSWFGIPGDGGMRNDFEVRRRKTKPSSGRILDLLVLRFADVSSRHPIPWTRTSKASEESLLSVLQDEYLHGERVASFGNAERTK